MPWKWCDVKIASTTIKDSALVIMLTMTSCRTIFAPTENERTVTGMAEYIEREAAIEAIMCEPPDAHYPQWYVDKIKSIPAADVAPVRHGRWIASHDEFCACSICKYPVYVGWNQTNYCPNCGAIMDAAVTDYCDIYFTEVEIEIEEE